MQENVKQDINEYRELFRIALDNLKLQDFLQTKRCEILEGNNLLWDIYQTLPNKKIILKGVLEIPKQNYGRRNLLDDCLELISWNERRFMLFFSLKEITFLISAEMKPEALEILTNLFNHIKTLFTNHIIQLANSGVELYNDYLFTDYKALDVVEMSDNHFKKDCAFGLMFGSPQANYRANNLLGDWYNEEVFGITKRFNRKYYDSLMLRIDDYHLKLGTVCSRYSTLLSKMDKEELKKTDREKLFFDKVEKEGLYFPS